MFFDIFCHFFTPHYLGILTKLKKDAKTCAKLFIECFMHQKFNKIVEFSTFFAPYYTKRCSTTVFLCCHLCQNFSQRDMKAKQKQKQHTCA